MAINTDNASNNIGFLQILSSKLKNINICFNSSDQHVRCLAHVFNLAVQEFLKYLYRPSQNNISDEESDYEEYNDDDDKLASTISVVLKLRRIVILIRSSPQRRDKFTSQCRACNINPKMVILDVKTRWNSTFHMINQALELIEVGIIFITLCFLVI